MTTETRAVSSGDEEQAEGLTDILERATDVGEGEKTSLRQILGSFEGRAHGPLLLVPSILAISPLGTIPGMSIVLGTLIVGIALQVVAGKKHPWLPAALLDRELPVDSVEKTRDRLRPWTRRADRVLRPRLGWLVRPPAHRAIGGACTLLALTFYPLALVPFGVLAPGLGCTMFAAALTGKDGALALAGWVAALAAGWLLVWTL